MSRLAKLMEMLKADPADAFVLYGIAQEHAKVGTPEGHEQAVRYYDLCLTADPKYLYAYYHKAASLIELARLEDAKVTLETGIHTAKAERDPKALSELNAMKDQIE